MELFTFCLYISLGFIRKCGKSLKNNLNLAWLLNLITGYARLTLIFLSWCLWHHSPGGFVLFYALSAILDFFDGYFARRLDQCSSFGAWVSENTWLFL